MACTPLPGFAGEATVELFAVSRGELIPLLVDVVNLEDNLFSFPLSLRLKILIGRFRGAFFIGTEGCTVGTVLLIVPDAIGAWGVCTVAEYIGCFCVYCV